MSEPEGQLWQAERDFLYGAVRQMKPLVVLEIGTWKGGGSTMQITNALRDTVIGGKLFTCDPSPEMVEIAKALHKDDRNVYIFKFGSTEMIKMMLQKNLIPDLVFFDGPEDADTALNDIQMLEPHMRSSSTFMMHDWDPPSIKASKIRPYMESNPGWVKIKQLTAPDSVGICRYQKI